MHIFCAACNQKLNVPDSALGKKIRCPKCQAVIPVPGKARPGPPPEMIPAIPEPDNAEEESGVGSGAPKRRKKKRKRAAGGVDKRIWIGVGAGSLTLVVLVVVLAIAFGSGPTPQGDPAVPPAANVAAEPQGQAAAPVQQALPAALTRGLVFDEPLPGGGPEKRQPWGDGSEQPFTPVRLLLPITAADMKKAAEKSNAGPTNAGAKETPPKEAEPSQEGERLPPRPGDRTGIMVTKAKAPEQWTKPSPPPPAAEGLIGAYNVPNTEPFFASAHAGFLAWWSPPDNPREFATLRFNAKTGNKKSQDAFKKVAVRTFKGLRWHRFDLRTGRLTAPPIKLGGLGNSPAGEKVDATAGMFAAAMSSDGERLAVRDPWNPTRVDVWDASGKPLLAIVPYAADVPVQWVGWSARGRLLTVGGGKCTAWDVSDGKAVFEIEGDYQLPVRTVRGGGWLAAGNGADIDILDADTGACLGRCVAAEEHDLSKPRDLAISPDATMLACIAWRKPADKQSAGILQSWDLTTGKSASAVPMNGPSYAMLPLNNTRVLLGGASPVHVASGVGVAGYQRPLGFKSVDFMTYREGPLAGSPDGRLWAFGPDPADQNLLPKEQKLRVMLRAFELPGYDTGPTDPRMVFTKETPLTVVVDLGNEERNRSFGENLLKSLQRDGFKIGKGGWTLRATCEVKSSETNLTMRGWAGGFVNVPRVSVSWKLYAPNGEEAHKTGMGLELDQGSKYYKGSRVVSKKGLTIEMEWTWEFPDRNPREAITTELLEGLSKRGDLRLIQSLAKFDGKWEFIPMLKNAVWSPVVSVAE